MKHIKKKYSNKKPPIKVLLALLGICFASVIVVYYTLRNQIIASSCMTVQQVQADKRCLYIYQNQVYLPPSTPHHGHLCGTDVGNSMPSSHSDGRLLQSSPYYIANICPAVTPSITPTTTPIPPSSTPIPSVTTVPTNNPSPSISATAQPTIKPTSSPCKRNSSIDMEVYNPETGNINCDKNDKDASGENKNSNNIKRDNDSNKSNQSKDDSIWKKMVDGIKKILHLE